MLIKLKMVTWPPDYKPSRSGGASPNPVGPIENELSSQGNESLWPHPEGPPEATAKCENHILVQERKHHPEGKTGLGQA